MTEIGQKGLKFAFFGQKPAILNFPEPPVITKIKINYFYQNSLPCYCHEFYFISIRQLFVAEPIASKKYHFSFYLLFLNILRFSEKFGTFRPTQNSVLGLRFLGSLKIIIAYIFVYTEEALKNV